MQQGSLVECILDITQNKRAIEIASKYNVTLPVKGIIYTIRDIEGEYVRLEEIVNGIMPKKEVSNTEYGEPWFNKEGFREVQPPMIIDIESMIEETIKETV